MIVLDLQQDKLFFRLAGNQTAFWKGAYPMSDNLRRFRSIQQSLKKLYPVEPKGNLLRHLHTLAALMSGIVGSRSCQLPQVATKIVDQKKPESRVKKYSRWLANENIDYETYYLPYVETLLASLTHNGRPLVVVIDGSVVGRGCLTLMLSAVYKGRALPLIWTTLKASKGHLAEEVHLALLERAQAIVPANATVIFLGDGEFDGAKLIKTITSCGWQFVCRTANNRRLQEENESFSFRQVDVSAEEYFHIPNACFDNAPGLRFHAVMWWQRSHEEQLYLISNIELPHEVLYWYKKRYRIETFFADQKSRGFHLHKSHLADPDRLNRLMIAACLAYIWIVYLGIWTVHHNWHHKIHRTDRCDLSLFQLGLRMLEHCLSQGKHFPMALQLDLFDGT
jgi:hypothetical protein